MQDYNGSGWSIANLRGTPLAVVMLFILAVLGLFGLGFSFRGSVML